MPSSRSSSRPVARPPRLARWLLTLLLPQRHRRHVLDDLADEYATIARLTGPAEADRWYRGQLRRSIAPALQMRTYNRLPYWRTSVLDFLRDLAQGLRRLRRRPLVSATILVTLALGAGINAATFTVLYDVLLRPLPYPEPARLVALSHEAPGGATSTMDMSWATWLHYDEHASGIEDGGLYQNAVVNLTDGADDAERIRLTMATPGVLSTLGVEPAAGRLFRPEEELEEESQLLILSHGLWTRRYGADPAVIGRTVEINSRAREVIGVLPEGLTFPESGSDAWLLLTRPTEIRTFGGFFLHSVVRMTPGTSPTGLAAELDASIPMLADRFGPTAREVLAETGLRTAVTPLHGVVTGNVGGILWPLFATMGLVLAVACVNVTLLLLVQAEHGRHETAVRRALGASRMALLRLNLSESLLFGVGAGLLGTGVALLSVQVFLGLAPAALPRLDEIAIGGPEILYLFALTLAATQLLGALAARVGPGHAELSRGLRGGGRGRLDGPSSSGLRTLAVGLQIAGAMVLLVGSGLMLRSFVALTRVDPGFEAESVLTLDVSLPARPYRDREAAFFDELLERVRALPGVIEAGAVSHLPLAPYPFAGGPMGIESEERPLQPGENPPLTLVKLITPGYLRAMRVRLDEGIGPDDPELVGERRPMLLSRSLASRLFPGESAVGKRVRMYGDAEDGYPWATVVGVVAPVHDRALELPARDVLYLPVLEGGTGSSLSPGFMSLTVKTSVLPSSLIGPIREAVQEIDPAVPISNVRTMQQLLDAATARWSLVALLLGGAATLALLLGSVGLYGILSHSVSQRTREIGLRVALGADARRIGSLLARQGLAPVLGGIAVGSLASVVLGRLLGSLLYEVAPADPVAMAAGALMLTVVAAVATALPTVRAVRIDPVRALAAD